MLHYSIHHDPQEGTEPETRDQKTNGSNHIPLCNLWNTYIQSFRINSSEKKYYNSRGEGKLDSKEWFSHKITIYPPPPRFDL